MLAGMHEDMMGEIEHEPARPKVTDAKGILQQNRVFLDLFWDIAKPEQEVRLRAIEDLITYLRASEKPDELTYTVKRLVDGLAHTREAARPGFSLALGQVLSVFEEVPLRSAFDQIKEKHNLETVKKKLIRNATFGNFFGVLALSQSTRLPKEPQVVLECVQLLQSLSQHREHLRDLPRKTMVDILSETSEEVFEEVLLGALQSDLASAFSSPEQMQLLLVAMQKFPQMFKPKKLKKLLGTATIITSENVPKLVEVLKMAARSVKKDVVLPAVALDLLQAALREGDQSFQLFWGQVISQGMLREKPGPTHYLSFRLLGAALPLLSLAQLKKVMSGDVMKHYGEHVVSAQMKDRFRFTPEMETYVGDFLQGCEDQDKQLAVVLGFSLLTNQGYPVVPSTWRVVQHLRPPALQAYVAWLKDMFLHPQMEMCLDFSTSKQKENQEKGVQKEECFFRLRRWIVPRLTSIVENYQVKKEEDLVMDIARFVFFHAFFSAKKPTPDIPETEAALVAPLDDRTRAVLVNSFFGLLLSLNHLPVLGGSAEGGSDPPQTQKYVQGVTADGSLWSYCLVRYADVLLTQPRHAQTTLPFTPPQRQAWDSMLASVEKLVKKAKKDKTPETSSFQQLFLLVGIHLWKAPEEFVDLMEDLQNCMTKAQEKKTKKKKKTTAEEEEEEEPHWAEVLVDILLSLLSQTSRHIRQVCKTVFTGICPHVTARALTAILDVLDPDKDEEDSAVVVVDEKDSKKVTKKGEEQDEDMEDDSDSSDDDDDEDEEEKEGGDEAMEEDENAEVDQNFRIQLMKVLQSENALATEKDGSDEDDELDDEAMMKLDDNIAALFLEQKKKIQAKKDQKDKLKKEKTLVRDFKIKVLDLLEVFLARQGSSPLVLGMVEPLLSLIENGMSSGSDQQEQDFLRKAADIFRNQLLRSKQYCRTVGDRQGELHALLEKLLARAQRLNESSVSLFFFSASVYLVKVLRGPVPTTTADKDTKTTAEKDTKTTAEKDTKTTADKDTKTTAEKDTKTTADKDTKTTAEKDTKTTAAAVSTDQLRFMGGVDVARVSAIFKEALCSFMTRRKSPLTGPMFIDLFERFPVVCVNLLDTAVGYITTGVREHQQGQASFMVLKALQTREVVKLLAGEPWTQLCVSALGQVAASLRSVEECKNKVVQEKVSNALTLSRFLINNILQQKLAVDLGPIQAALESLTRLVNVRHTSQLSDVYWANMKFFGVPKPRMKKVKKTKEEKEKEELEQQNVPKKKKGFLPDTKKRSKNRKKQIPVSEKGAALPEGGEGGGGGGRNKKNKSKNKKRKQPGGEEAPAPSGPAKKAQTQPAGPPRKKKKKQGGGNDGQNVALWRAPVEGPLQGPSLLL